MDPWSLAGRAAGPIIFALLVAAYYILYKGFRFLLRYHQDYYLPSRDTLSAIWAVVKSMRWWNPFWLKAESEASLTAARLAVEYQILNPPPEKPHALDFATKDAHADACNEWRRERSTWSAERSSEIRRLLRVTRQLDEARKQGTHPEVEPNDIEIPNLASIDKQRDAIRRYFAALRLYFGSDDSQEFVSNVLLKSGYIAPLFLISGLMTRFDQEWGRIIDEYNSLFSDEDRALKSRSLIEIQTFEFNCWLLWGPSIPMCDCAPWRCKTSSANVPSVFQYGFGDENNSLSLCVDGPRAQGVVHHLLQRLGGGGAHGRGSKARIYAHATGVRAKIARFNEKDAGKRLSEIHLSADSAKRVMLKLSDEPHGVDPFVSPVQPQRLGRELREEETSHYYSAYVWVMFLITDSENRLLHTEEGELWKNLLPFFQHANIADVSTYSAIKSSLIAKSCSAIVSFLERTDRRDASLRLHYVCAFDDCGCGQPVIFPPPQGESIRQLMDDGLAWAREKNLGDGKIDWSRVSFGDPVGQFSASALPKIIDDFFRVIEERRKAAEEKGKKQRETAKAPA